MRLIEFAEDRFRRMTGKWYCWAHSGMTFLQSTRLLEEINVLVSSEIWGPGRFLAGSADRAWLNPS
jgi:hypothetical protein